MMFIWLFNLTAYLIVYTFLIYLFIYFIFVFFVV